jgi:hypothetical protein
VAGEGITLEPAKSVLDRVDQGPVEIKQIAPGSAREDYPCHRSAIGPALSQLLAKLGQPDRLVSLQLSKSCLERGERVGIREDLGGLLQCLVFIRRHDRRGRTTVAGHEQMVTPFGDIVEQPAQVAP